MSVRDSTSNDDAYAPTWRRIKRLTRLGLLLIPLGFGLICSTKALLPSSSEWVLVVTGSLGGAWLGAIAVTFGLRNGTRCPRCAKEFFVRRAPLFVDPAKAFLIRREVLLRDHFTDHCLNCALPRGASRQDVAPEAPGA
jgi:hypothetical protein